MSREANSVIKKRYRLAHPEIIKNYNKKYYEKNKEKFNKEKKKVQRRLRIYKLTSKEFSKYLNTQKNKCGICRTVFSDKKPYIASVDHNHHTGKIRGLLCGRCNSAIGLFKEDLIILKNSLEWLSKEI
jgi:site-specific DNA-adenine methylase